MAYFRWGAFSPTESKGSRSQTVDAMTKGPRRLFEEAPTGQI